MWSTRLDTGNTHRELAALPGDARSAWRRSRPRRSVLKGPVLLVVLLGLLAMPAVAGNKIVTLTETGSDPGVAVAPDGTVHAAWDDPSDSFNYVTYYCRMATATSGCAAPMELDIPQGYQQFSPPRVFVLSPQTIIVVATRSGGFTTPNGHKSRVVFSFLSTDGGTTFSSPKMIGTAESSGDMIADAASVYIISDSVTGGTFFQAAQHSSGSFSSATINLAADSSQAYDGALALHQAGGTTKLVAVFSDLETVFYRVWSGSGSPNDISTWGAVQALDQGQDAQMASGPNGAFVMYRQVREPVSKSRYVVRRFTGEGFGNATVVGNKNTSSQGDFFQDARGRLHVLKTQYNGGPVYRTSMDGIRWTPRTEVVSDEQFGVDGRALAAHSNEDGNGAVLWTRAGNNARLKIIHASAPGGRCSLALQGTAAADSIAGGSTADTIFGLGGNDTLDGAGGADCLLGAGGNDTITGGPGTDRLSGGAGNDRVNARDESKDKVMCGPGSKDVAVVDKGDVVKGCEKVSRT